jgi:O-antigen ligase
MSGVRDNKLNQIIGFALVLCITTLFPLIIYIKPSGYDPYSQYELWILGVLIVFTSIIIISNRKINTTYLFIVILYILFQCTIAFLTTGLNEISVASIILHDKYIIFSFLVFYFIEGKNETYLVIFTVLIGCISAYMGIYKSILEGSLLMNLLTLTGGYKRGTVLFANSNMFGVYMSVCAMFSFLVINSFRKRKYKILFVVFILCPILICILLTFSRRSWSVLIIGFIIFNYKQKGKKMVSVLSALTMLILLIIYADFEIIFTRFLTIFDLEYSANSSRIRETLLLYKSLSENFYTLFAGDGVGNYGPTSIYYQNIQSEPLHNYYLHIMLEFGVIGLLMYMMIFIKTLNMAISKNKIKFEEKTLVYIIILCSLYVIGFVGETPISFPLSMYQWVIIGLILKNTKECGSQSTLDFTSVRLKPR